MIHECGFRYNDEYSPSYLTIDRLPNKRYNTQNTMEASAQNVLQFIVRVEPFDLSNTNTSHARFNVADLPGEARPVKEMQVAFDFSRETGMKRHSVKWDDGFTTPLAARFTMNITPGLVVNDHRHMAYMTLSMRKHLDNAAFDPNHPHLDRLGAVHIPLAKLIEPGLKIESRFANPLGTATNFKFSIESVVHPTGVSIERSTVSAAAEATTTTGYDEVHFMTEEAEWMRGENCLSLFGSKGGDMNTWLSVASQQNVKLDALFVRRRLGLSLREMDLPMQEFIDAVQFLMTGERGNSTNKRNAKRAQSTLAEFISCNKAAIYNSDKANCAMENAEGQEISAWLDCEKESSAIMDMENDCEGLSAIAIAVFKALCTAPPGIIRSAGKGAAELQWLANQFMTGIVFCAAKSGKASISDDATKEMVQNSMKQAVPLKNLTEDLLRDGSTAGHAFFLMFPKCTPQFDAELDAGGKLTIKHSGQDADQTHAQRRIKEHCNSVNFGEMTSTCTTTPFSERRAGAVMGRQLLSHVFGSMKEHSPADRLEFKETVKHMKPLNPISADVLPAVNKTDPDYAKEDTFALRMGLFFCNDKYSIVGTCAANGTDFKAGATAGEAFNKTKRKVAIMRLNPHSNVANMTKGRLDPLRDMSTYVVRGSTRKPPPIPEWLTEMEQRINKNKRPKFTAAASTTMFPLYSFFANEGKREIAERGMKRLEPFLTSMEVTMEDAYNDNYFLMVRVGINPPKATAPTQSNGGSDSKTPVYVQKTMAAIKRVYTAMQENKPCDIHDADIQSIYQDNEDIRNSVDAIVRAATNADTCECNLEANANGRHLLSCNARRDNSGNASTKAEDNAHEVVIACIGLANSLRALSHGEEVFKVASHTNRTKSEASSATHRQHHHLPLPKESKKKHRHPQSAPASRCRCPADCHCPRHQDLQMAPESGSQAAVQDPPQSQDQFFPEDYFAKILAEQTAESVLSAFD